MPPALLAVLPAVIGTAGGLGAAALASRGQNRATDATQAQLNEDNAVRRQILGIIQPFAQQLINLGMNPQEILNSPLGVSLLQPGRQAISQNYDQARQNLMDLISGSGFSPQSGVSQGPLANLFSEEANAQSNLMSQLPLQALQLGMQGSNLLAGQQAQFNPNGALSAFAQLSSTPSAFNQALANLPASIGGILSNYRNQNQGTNQSWGASPEHSLSAALRALGVTPINNTPWPTTPGG